MLKRILILNVLMVFSLKAMQNDLTNFVTDSPLLARRGEQVGENSPHGSLLGDTFTYPSWDWASYSFKNKLDYLATGVAKTINERQAGLFPLGALLFDYIQRGELYPDLARGIRTISSFALFGTGVTIIKNAIPKHHYPKNSLIQIALEQAYVLYISAKFLQAYRACSDNDIVTKNFLLLGTCGIGAYLAKEWADRYLKNKSEFVKK